MTEESTRLGLNVKIVDSGTPEIIAVIILKWAFSWENLSSGFSSR